MKKRLLCLTFIFAVLNSATQASTQNDSLLLLLKDAAKSNYLVLSKKPIPAYFLSYRVENIENNCVESEFGRISDESAEKKSSLFVEIRVGNPAFDNYHAFQQQFVSQYRVDFPYDYNRSLMMKIISRATEQAFEKSSHEFAILLSQNSLVAKNDNIAYLFESSDPNEYFEPQLITNFEREYWKDQVRFYTSDMSQFLNKASAKLSHTVKRSYFVSSEDVFIAENQEYTYLELYVEGFSSDNSLNHLSHRYFSNNPLQLPDKYAVNQKMKQMEELLFQVLDAEKISKAYCPVLLSPKVASVVMHNVLGHASVNPEEIELLQILSDKNIFSVKSDPSMKYFGNSVLSGSYLYDYEGVLGDAVQVLSKGATVNLLSNRTQNKLSQQSNGHGRQSPVTSNLIVQAYKPMSQSNIENNLKSILKERMLEYAIYVVDADVVCDKSEKIKIYPTVCYKIFNDNKPDRMVKNVVVESDKKTFVKNIVCAGDSLASEALFCNAEGGKVPTHSCSPSILVSNLNCSPVLPVTAFKYYHFSPPSFDMEEDNLSEMFFKVAEKTHRDNLEELHGRTENAPYYSEFLLTDATSYHVLATEGSILNSEEKELKSVSPRLLVGNDKFNNENLYIHGNYDRNIYKLPDELDNHNLYRSLSAISRNEYENVLIQWNLKNMISDKLQKNRLLDRSTEQKLSERVEEKRNFHSVNYIGNRVSELSEMFNGHSLIHSSSVDLTACLGNAIFWNSENISYVKPVSFVRLRLAAHVRDQKGNLIENKKDILIDDLEQLFVEKKSDNDDNSPNIVDMVSVFIGECEMLARSFSMEEDYYGPVLLKGEAVGQFLAKSLLEGSTGIISKREPDFIFARDREVFTPNNLDDKRDQIVTNKNLTVFVNSDTNTKFITDAEGVKLETIEIIRNGELIDLVNDCIPSKSEIHSNGGRQIAVSKSGFVSCKGVETMKVEFRKSVSEEKVYKQFLHEAAKRGHKFAYCIERISENGEIVLMYRINVKDGKKIAVSGGKLPILDFYTLQNATLASNESITSTEHIEVGNSKFKEKTVLSLKIKSPKILLLNTLPIAR